MGKFSNNQAIDIEQDLGDLIQDMPYESALNMIEQQYGSYGKTYAEYILEKWKEYSNA
tara:strand:- start:653 stop:826 length:174 start_codon:yes stop_codon:yes gene_type:complete